MPMRDLPNLALKGFFDLGEDGWDDEMSLNLLKLSVLVQATALDKVSADPGAPVDGDVYIFDETHATHPNEVAIRDDGAWVYVTPFEGWLIFNQAAGYYEKFDGAAWTELETGGGGGASAIGVSGQTANYTAVLGDANNYIRMNSASAVSFTIPANASVAYDIGTRMYVEQRGVGTVTVLPDTGVTLRSRGSIYDTAGQYAVAVVIKVDTDTWVLSGDIA